MFSGYGQGWLTSLSTGRTRDLGCHPGLSPLPHTTRSAPHRALADALISDERVQLPLPGDCKRFCWKALWAWLNLRTFLQCLRPCRAGKPLRCRSGERTGRPRRCLL